MAEGPVGLVHAFLRHIILQEGDAPARLRPMREAGPEPAELPMVPAAAPWGCGRAEEKEERRRLKQDLPTIYLVCASDQSSVSSFRAAGSKRASGAGRGGGGLGRDTPVTPEEKDGQLQCSTSSICGLLSKGIY